MPEFIQNIIQRFQPIEVPMQNLYLEVTNPLVIGRTLAYTRNLANRPLEVTSLGGDSIDHDMSDATTLKEGDILRIRAKVTDEEFLIALIGRRFNVTSHNH